MVTTLYLLRHGETEDSEAKRYKGSIDVPLSIKGIEQMKWVSAFVKEKINGQDLKVYSSPLIRALKSAEIIAEPYGISPVVIPDLRERSFGIWEGMSFTEIKEKYPDEFEAWANNPLKYSPPKGESTLEVRDRVIKALDIILNSTDIPENQRLSLPQKVEDTPTPKNRRFFVDPNSSESPRFRSNIAIVAHGGVNRIILCHIMGIPLENIFRIEQDFGCVNIIEFWGKYPVVKALNLAVALEQKCRSDIVQNQKHQSGVSFDG